MNIAVLGAQWGDEGKGKVVDLLTPHFAVVARYQGGHNAGHTVYVGHHEDHSAAAAVGNSPLARVVRHRQRGRHRSAGALHRDRRARQVRIRRDEPPAHQRARARDPSVSSRARSAVGSEARRAQDRHDVARHRPGLRRQDRPPGHPRVRSVRSRGSRAGDPRERAGPQPPDQGIDARLAAVVRSDAGLRRADEAVGHRYLRVSGQNERRRAGRSSSKARRARCSTSITAPIRSSPRRTRRSAACAPASASARR